MASYINDEDGSTDSLSFESTPEDIGLNFFKAYCEERGVDFTPDELSEFERTYPTRDRIYTVVSQVDEGAGSQTLE